MVFTVLCINSLLLGSVWGRDLVLTALYKSAFLDLGQQRETWSKSIGTILVPETQRYINVNGYM